MCCNIFLGTPAERSDCTRAFALPRNVGAFPGLPFSTPPSTGAARSVVVRAWSTGQPQDLAARVWVHPPMQNGVIVGNPSPYTLANFNNLAAWTLRGGLYYKNVAFSFTPASQAQVNEGVCFVVKLEVAGNALCSCPAASDPLKHPLAAVFDRPW